MDTIGVGPLQIVTSLALVGALGNLVARVLRGLGAREQLSLLDQAVLIGGPSWFLAWVFLTLPLPLPGLLQALVGGTAALVTPALVARGLGVRRRDVWLWNLGGCGLGVFLGVLLGALTLPFPFPLTLLVVLALPGLVLSGSIGMIWLQLGQTASAADAGPGRG